MIDDAYVQTASACFDMAQNAVRRIDPTLNSCGVLRDAAEREVIYLLLHFLNRLLFEADRSTINERMSALATSALRHYAQAARDGRLWAQVEDHMAQDRPDYGANNELLTREQYKHFLFGVLSAGGDIPERPLAHEEWNTVSGDATNRFMFLYCDRQFEYGALTSDWFRPLLVKFGENFCDAVGVNKDEEDYSKMFAAAQANAAQMFDTLRTHVPGLLATAAT